jgi:hypothetical protein
MAIDWELIDENSKTVPVGAQTFILDVVSPKEISNDQLLIWGFQFNEDGVVLNRFEEGFLAPKITFQNLGEVLAFVAKWGRVVISPAGGYLDKQYPTIQIYNSWRE